MPPVRPALLLSLALIAVSPVASAQDWIVSRYQTNMDVQGSATEDYVQTGVRVRTADPNLPEVRFGCSERLGLTVTLRFVPAVDVDPNPRNARISKKSARLTIGDREPEKIVWTYVKATRVLQSRSQKTAAAIYNAVVTGQSVTIDEPFHGETTFPTPAPDADFERFASLCHVTNGGH